VTNKITTVAPPGGAGGNSCYLYRFVQLPNGQVLVSDSGSQLYVYTPAGGPLASWRPTITKVQANGGGIYTLTGRQINGRTEGTYYGDDVANSSNFPLVRLTNTGTGRVYYCRTFNWAPGTMGTGPLVSLTTQFQLPAGLPKATYSLTVIANGIASNAVNLSTPSSFSVTPQFSDGGSLAGFAPWLPGLAQAKPGMAPVGSQTRHSDWSSDSTPAPEARHSSPSVSNNALHAIAGSSAASSLEGLFVFDALVAPKFGATLIQ
jgi:hypothetical protein